MLMTTAARYDDFNPGMRCWGSKSHLMKSNKRVY